MQEEKLAEPGPDDHQFRVQFRGGPNVPFALSDASARLLTVFREPTVVGAAVSEYARVCDASPEEVATRWLELHETWFADAEDDVVRVSTPIGDVVAKREQRTGRRKGTGR